MDYIHYTPLPNSRNVRCLNGSAHIYGTSDLNGVTCPLCLDISTHREYWSEKRELYYQQLRTKTAQNIFIGKF